MYSGNAESYSLIPSWDWFWPGGLEPGRRHRPGAAHGGVHLLGLGHRGLGQRGVRRPRRRPPGRAAILSTVLLLVTYTLVSTAAVAFAGVGTTGIGLGNPDNADDVFAAIGPALFGDTALGTIGLLLLSASILTSASASTQTTILPTARTTLSMAAYKAMPAAFAKIHPRYLTPGVSTIAMGLASMLFYAIFTLISPSLLTALIGSVGLMIAFYYGLTGFACSLVLPADAAPQAARLLHAGRAAVAGRPDPAGRVRVRAEVVRRGRTGCRTTTATTSRSRGRRGGGRRRGRDPHRRGAHGRLATAGSRRSSAARRCRGRGSHDLVLVGSTAADEPVFRLPDSGLPGIVIAPDLSNLPTGARAVDPVTGDEVRPDDEP